MRLSRRLAMFGALAMSGFAPANADTGPFEGIWSATFVDTETGLGHRARLEITADGKATLTLIDLGNVPWTATGLHLTPPNLTINWDTIGLRLSGVLTDNDTIQGHISGPNVDQPGNPVFKRGDLFPVNTTVLPHAVMSAERLHQLRLVSDAPALGVAYAFKNQPDHVWVDGVRSVETESAVTPADCWHIGSCTKSMTATLAARLVEAGRIRWTTTIGEVLGQRVRGMNPAYREANLLHLLSHRAGLMRDAPGGKAYRHRPGVPVSAERLVYVTRLLREAPIARLGEANIYSNGGFVTAGAMLEIAGGKPYETLMRDEVFAPLGMTTAGFGLPDFPNAPRGHGHGPEGRLVPVKTIVEFDAVPPCINPCGGVHLSLGDLLAYLKAHRDHPKLLSEDTWKTLHTPPFPGSAALGWGVRGDGVLEHAGSDGFWWVQVQVSPWGMVFAAAQNAATPAVISVMTQAADSAARSWD
jgi:CubicO group peptidase (beta-lactamase class C family)